MWKEIWNWFLKKIWEEFQPYFQIIIVDFLIGVTLWGALAAFHLLTMLLPVHGAAAETIGVIHAFGVLGCFGVLAVSLVWDVGKIKWEKLR